MRYWAAGFLLTVLLFGGALLGAGKDTGTSRPVPDADPGQTGTVPGQSAADGTVLLRNEKVLRCAVRNGVVYCDGVFLTADALR